MKKMFCLLFGVLLLSSFTREGWALALDEKLPLRVLETSDSKKTILINRGVEDGLVVGDHARFFLTTGVVARAVVIEASPARSVWSVYKLVAPEEIERDKVMNLKITEPVKLANDPSKMLSKIDLGDVDKQEVVLAEGPTDYQKVQSEVDKMRLERMQTQVAGVAEGATSSESTVSGSWVGMSDRTMELWGTFHMDNMKSNNSLGSDQTGSRGEARTYNVMLGLEKYFHDYDAWYGDLSFSPFVHYGDQQYTTLEGHEVGTRFMGAGLALNYHFISPPLSYGRPIFFLTGSGGAGQVEERQKLNNVQGEESTTLKGTYNFVAVGIGFKYFFFNGLGFRVIADYYQRAEVYAVAESTDKYTKEVKGPRAIFGLSYRW